jgi:hypothetical protein
MRPSAFTVTLLGLFFAVILSAALIAADMRCLDTPWRSMAHYGCAVFLALLLQLLSRRRTDGAIGASSGPPVLAAAVLSVLLTFALRRWLGLRLWVNLEALRWGSGPAGELTAVALPLEGLIFGLVAAADARPRDLGAALPPIDGRDQRVAPTRQAQQGAHDAQHVPEEPEEKARR